MRPYAPLAVLLISAMRPVAATAQDAASAAPQAQAAPTGPVFYSRTNIVLVPALVRTKSGEPVFALKAADFTLTDDDVPQELSLVPDTDSEPLALVIAVQLGGTGTRHLDDYRSLGTTLEALVGNVPHRVALVGFDSTPHLLVNFTPDINTIATALHDLGEGDNGAAIYDALRFSVEGLQKKAPPDYRRAILLLSETVDHGSRTPLDQTVRSVSDTNTVIYSFAFSSTRSDAAHEAGQFNTDQPGPPGGCFAADPNAPPSEKKGKAEKTYDCLSDLAPPLRAAKIATLAIMNALRRNAPETVAHLTGGDYYGFKDQKSLQKAMLVVSNHVPNRYILSFRPQSPHPGVHTLKLELKDYPKLQIEARRNYWADDANVGKPQ